MAAPADNAGEPSRPPAPSAAAGTPRAVGPVDLHTHSRHSDGSQPPAELVQEADRRGLRVLGLTDHDTVSGLAEAEAEAARLGLELVPGVELSTGGRDGAPEIHLLGYFVDRDDPDLVAALAAYAHQRLVRLERIAERLAAAGVPIDPERVVQLAGPGTVGRPHIARALIERGYVADLGEAFDRFLRAGRPGFVPRPHLDPEQGIATIRAAGGVAVLAHPFSTGDVEETVARLVAARLAGLEVDYGEYDDEARAWLRAIADNWGLVPTGGSDYHGPGFRPGRELGGPAVPLESVERLRAVAVSQRDGRRARP